MDIEEAVRGYGHVFEILILVDLAVLMLAAFEFFWDVVVRKVRAAWETVINTLILVGNIVIERTLFGSLFVIGLFVGDFFAVYTLPVNGWTWLVALVLTDLSYYWMHRTEHEVRLFWSYHSTHHSSEEYNLSTGVRLSWWEGAVEWIFFVPLVLLGFAPVQVLVCIVVVVTYQGWLHTERLGTLGFLEGIINTPSAHRVHHGSNGSYLDKNHGGILMIWDRLFGTYEPEGAPVIYGLVTPLPKTNPVWVNFYEVGCLLRDVWKAKSWRNRWHYVLGKPGWTPNSEA